MATQMQSPLNQRVVAHSLPATQEAATRALSQMMGSADNWAMFKGHHTLNVRNLLHLQNQLDELARKHEQDDPNFDMNELDEVLYRYSELYSFSQGYLFSCYLADLDKTELLLRMQRLVSFLSLKKKMLQVFCGIAEPDSAITPRSGPFFPKHTKTSCMEGSVAWSPCT